MKIKCIDNRGNFWFTVGKEYRAWTNGGMLHSESELDAAFLGKLNNKHGVFEMVEEEKPHPHADLMLKYAMIAQYDDKPWESFECLTTDGEWVGKSPRVNFMPNGKYRLKPQEPKIQIGQIWVSKEGVEVMVINLANKLVFTKIEVGGLTIPWSFKESVFFGNFKLKE